MQVARRLMGCAAGYVVVGSGITGATIARVLHDAGTDVLVVERRNRVGGNVHDYVHACGARIHTYGPHYFRTNAAHIWEFVNRFAVFFPYRAVVKSLVDGRHESWPVNESYLASLSAEDRKISFVGRPESFEEACLAAMPAVVYAKFVKGYTRKQWGVEPALLSADLAGRFEVRKDTEHDFSRHVYQGIPALGYAHFMERLVAGIPVITDVDYLVHRAQFKPRRMLIFTGAIDAYFGFDLGRLAYRAQRREHFYHEAEAWVQSVGQVNNPSPAAGGHIRTIEWKHMMPAAEQAGIRGTVTTREYPYSPHDADAFEYPFPDRANQLLYRKYRERADELADTLICGRLGEYRYYDMDQALARGLILGKRILEGR